MTGSAPISFNAGAESRDRVSANTSCWVSLRRRTSGRPIAPLAAAIRILIALPFRSLCGDSKRGQVMLSYKHATHRGSRPGSKAFSQFDQLPGRLEITCRRPWAGRRRHSASSRSAPSARSALVSTGSGSHGPTRSRVAHADCATLMESRVVVVARNAAGSFTARRSVACYRSQTSCTRSSAFHRAAQHAVGDAEERGGANEDRSGVIEGSRSFGAGGLIDWHLSRTAAL